MSKSSGQPLPDAVGTRVLSGTLVLPDGVVEDGVVEIRDGRLGFVGDARDWRGERGEPVGTIAPGLIDMHCHGGGGHSFGSADVAEIRSAAAHHVARGTTTLLASLVSAPTDDISRGVAAIGVVVADPGGPVLGAHLEGPWIDPGHCGAHDVAHLVAPDASSLAAWLAPVSAAVVAGVAGSRPVVRMLTLAPELPGATELARQLEAAGVIVALGHTGADVTTFARGLADLRAPVVTHLFNGMDPMHHRNPGPVSAALDALARGAVHVEVIADDVHVAPAMVRMTFDIAPPGHVVLISDAMPAAGVGDGDYLLGSRQVRVTDGQAFTVGERPSLAGSTAHLADTVRCAIVSAGVEPAAAVRAATATPAALLGLLDRGRLATGLRADLVTFDPDWQVTRVMRDGSWVR